MICRLIKDLYRIVGHGLTNYIWDILGVLSTFGMVAMGQEKYIRDVVYDRSWKNTPGEGSTA